VSAPPPDHPAAADADAGPPLRRLIAYAGAHRRAALISTGWSVANKAFDIAPELLIGVAVDVVVRGQGSIVSSVFGVDDRFHQLLVLALVNLIVWVAESVTEYLAAIGWRSLAQTIEHEARMDAYAHVQRLELGALEDRETGDLLAVLNDDVNQLERFLDVGANRLILTVMNVVLVGLVFLVISPLLAVLAFLPIPVIVVGSLAFQKRLEPLYATVRDRAGAMGAVLANNLAGLATIKSFTAEDREVARIGAVSLAYQDANRRAIRVSSAFVPLIRMAILAGFTTTLVVGGKAALDGRLEVGAFSVLVFMTQRLLWPLTQLGEVLDLYQRGMASTRRILDLLDVPARITGGTGVLPAPVAGAVRLDDVRFGYTRSHPPTGVEVLRGVTLDVPAGRTHAIVGPTGAGKSTLVKLLLRLEDPTAGTISIDGVPLPSLRLESLRGALGYVAQDVFLFSGTIRDNVAYGRPGACDQEIREALAAAEALGFVEALPAGLDTLVGERGMRLSGGQRQRLSLARAILRDPAILLLDEATAAVDTETEAAIQRSLQNVSAGRTTVVIAHRLSTVEHADHVVVLDHGTTLVSGSPEDLTRQFWPGTRVVLDAEQPDVLDRAGPGEHEVERIAPGEPDLRPEQP
jgi:ATP-binding cassette subfamily B protein